MRLVLRVCLRVCRQRFARNSKRKSKLKIDKRFAAVLHDDRFKSVQGESRGIVGRVADVVVG